MYKYDGKEIMEKLSNRGYTTYKIRKEKMEAILL